MVLGVVYSESSDFLVVLNLLEPLNFCFNKLEGCEFNCRKVGLYRYNRRLTSRVFVLI